MNIVEIIGLFAAFFTTIAFIPQALQVYKTNKTKDLSLLTFVIFTSGLICWLLYGILLKALPIILANTLTLLMSFYILYKKIKNERNKDV